ncbi:hypothetical protein ABLE91_10975 [Aquabacter sp. CN5-332]|uniref:hypothetical protein n=1 Tax=Aquabacter sp. CN5-332 TaxID=3156608 RepID=UPI0032B47045
MADLPWAKEAHDSGLSVGVSAWADAVGKDTLAFADVSIDMQAFSWGAVAAGSAQTGAMAFGACGDAVSANAGSALDIAGADFVVVVNSSGMGGGFYGDTAWAANFSNSTFIAVDVAGFTLSCGPLVIEASAFGPILGAPALVDGNLASFDLSNLVKGDDTLATSDIQALTVQDQLSSVSAMLLAAVEHANFSNPNPTTPDDPDEPGTGGPGTGGPGGGGGGIVIVPPGDDGPWGGSDDDDDFGVVIVDDGYWPDGFDIADVPPLNATSRSGDAGAVTGPLGTEFTSSPGNMFHEVDVGGTPRPSPATLYEMFSGNQTGLVGGGPLPDDYSVDEAMDLDGGGGEGACNVCTALLPQEKEGTADIYDIAESGGCQTLQQFKTREGDRLIGLEGWSSEAALRAANGETLFLERSDCDAQDLIMTFLKDGEWHSLRLDDFFLLNPVFDNVSADDVLSDDEAVPILRAILQGGEEAAPEAAQSDVPPIGEIMSFLA